ncbi:zinc finger C2H2 domain-containing protein [Candidatus Nitrososphaera gargensis Ga9.2]|uniref:Zinc finger C2H2 domain-containing protein n=1 Tax=Nitrososphaera gargensis (strain Ga9.2) TaxID=1237085 RepID=K0IM62_NITGG|nr:hypothetical protein [Candidatus Nitrososphaera gargensis]AFU60032.1 zinc finger C2H2 domain-containing protein [Candidatus Nitrososphaera gargensis Ga9.2]
MSQDSVLIIWNQKQMFDRVVKLLENAKTEVLGFFNAYVFTITTDNEVFQIPKRAARKRGVKFRYITEITNDNISYCKRQLGLVDELRHLDRIRGNFIMNDSEFIASHDISPRNPITQGFYSSMGKMLKQERYVFQTLWDNAIPAEERIDQLEMGRRHDSLDSMRIMSDQAVVKEQKKTIIDRFYVCEACRSVFIYADDAEDHKTATSHKKIAEFPFFESNAT